MPGSLHARPDGPESVESELGASFGTKVMGFLRDRRQLEQLCRRYHIRRLALFGSGARGELRPDSDLDFLIEYDPNHRPRLVELQEIEDHLSALYGGRRVDLVNPRYLNPRLRDRIIAEAKIEYAEG